MVQSFDAGVDERSIFIITTEWNEEGDREVTKNYIPLERAREILHDLSLAIKEVEKMKEQNAVLRKGIFNLPK